MKVEVLASVMNTTLPETVEHMNLQSDAVIINQCDRLAYEEMKIAGHGGSAEADPREEYLIRYYSFPERGIGRSRNEAILRAEGDICLFSDGKAYRPVASAIIPYMRMATKQRSWRNLRGIPKRI